MEGAWKRVAGSDSEVDGQWDYLYENGEAVVTYINCTLLDVPLGGDGRTG